MIDINNAEVRFALEATRQAAILVTQIQSEMVSTALTKEDRSPVTIADYASQALLASLLERSFPNDPLVAEEDSNQLRTKEQTDTLAKVIQFVSRFARNANSPAVCNWIDRGAAQPSSRYWTLDPIDGTKGFLRGDQYVVALALVVDGKVQVGALGCPKLAEGHRPDMNGSGSLLLAQRGKGSWISTLVNGQQFDRVHVSDCQNITQARLLRSFESGHTNISKIEELINNLGIQAQAVRMDSQAKYAVLACGYGELAMRLISPSQPDYREKIWDQAAGSIIIKEAGGRISDLHGKPLDFRTGRMLVNNRGILASNGYLHQATLAGLVGVSA